MNFLNSLGFLALCGVVFYIAIMWMEARNHEIRFLQELLKGGIVEEFEEYLRTTGFSYETGLRKFFKEPGRKERAIEAKKERDALSHKFDEAFKKENILKRIFAYDYENFLFSLFSPLAIYNERENKWELWGCRIPVQYVKSRMEKEGYSNVPELYQSFIKNNLIEEDKNEQCELGVILKYHAEIVSEEDLDIDKWIKKNGQSMTKTELQNEIDCI